MGGTDARRRGPRTGRSRGAATVEYALLVTAVAGVLTFTVKDQVASTLRDSVDSFMHAFAQNLGSDGQPPSGSAPADPVTGNPIPAASGAPESPPTTTYPTPTPSPSSTPTATASSVS